MLAGELGRYLRRGSDRDLTRRRGIVGLALGAAASMGLITLYQMGIIRRLPDPPLRRFRASKVSGSAEAYELFKTPDGVLGLLSYGSTLALAACGGADRPRTQPVLPLLLSAKVGFDVLMASKLTLDQWTRHRAFCVYCLTASAATLAMIPLVIPESARALRTLLGRFRRATARSSR